MDLTREMRRLIAPGLMALATLAAPSLVHAAAEVQVVDAAFIPTLIKLDGTSTLRVELRNNGAGGQRATRDYSLQVPDGLVAQGHQLGEDCDAAAVTFVATPSSSGVVLTGLTLQPSGTCTVDVIVSATSTGSYTFSTPGNGSNILTTTLEVEARLVTEMPTVGVSPTAVPFPPQEVGGSAARQVTLKNPGTSPIIISGIFASGPFGTTHECDTVTLSAAGAAGDTCTFSVVFTPFVTGPAAGTLQITSTNALSQSVALTGDGIAPLPSLSPAGALAFGAIAVNSSATSGVTLTNSIDATAALTIFGITTSGAFTRSHNCPSSLGVGDSCTINVSYVPGDAGVHGGSLTVEASADLPVLALSGSAFAMPLLDVAPASLGFGSQTINVASATQAVTLRNTGTATLNVTAIVASGDFHVDAGAPGLCNAPIALAPGASCTLPVRFLPTALGPRSGWVDISSNASELPRRIALAGTGTAAAAPGVAAMQLSTERVTFDPTFVGTTSSRAIVTVTNAGTGPMHIASIESTGDFGYSGCGFPSTLMPGESCVFAITFRPLSEGPLAGEIRLFSDAPGSPHSIVLAGTGSLVLKPEISLTPAALDFGAVRVGSEETQQMRLANAGNLALAISAISAAGAGFTQTNDCPGSLAAGAFCDIAVTYAPTRVGTHGGQIRIDSNATPDRYLAALSGTALPVPPPLLVVASALDFGQQLTESVTRVPLEIKNSGGSPLVISETRILGAPEFGLEGSCGPIEPKGSCILTVVFAPATAAVFAGRLEIASNHPLGVVRVELLGQGIARPRADLDLAVAGLGFGNQVVGSVSDERPVGLTNVGTAPLQFLAFNVPLDFLVDSSRCPAQLQPQQSCELRVAFKPMAPGPRGGELTIISNAIGAPHSVSLTGTGCRFFSMGAARNPGRRCAP